jgi:hypothetical protein
LAKNEPACITAPNKRHLQLIPCAKLHCSRLCNN